MILSAERLNNFWLSTCLQSVKVNSPADTNSVRRTCPKIHRHENPLYSRPRHQCQRRLMRADARLFSIDATHTAAESRFSAKGDRLEFSPAPCEFSEGPKSLTARRLSPCYIRVHHSAVLIKLLIRCRPLLRGRPLRPCPKYSTLLIFGHKFSHFNPNLSRVRS